MAAVTGGIELPIGSEFAGHRIEEFVASGGMGVLYRATDLRLRRTVALKLIAPDLSTDLTYRARFERESRSAAALRHPNIITIFQAGEDRGVLYITMEFVEGTDLRAMIARAGRLAPPVATNLTAQVASALDAAHAAGLVHRDVKPANILVHGDGHEFHAYLTDFGLAKRAAVDSSLTQAGAVMGTYDYMAPEQARGDPADRRADVYALGCVLYEALTGEVPFPRDTPGAKIFAHLSLEPPSVGGRVPEAGHALDVVIRKAMAKSPADRYPTAGDLGRAALSATRQAPADPAPRDIVEAPPYVPPPVRPQYEPPRKPSPFEPPRRPVPARRRVSSLWWVWTVLPWIGATAAWLHATAVTRSKNYLPFIAVSLIPIVGLAIFHHKHARPTSGVLAVAVAVWVLGFAHALVMRKRVDARFAARARGR